MAGISIFDVILIFLTSLTIEKIDFSALLKKMRLIQEDSNIRISLLLNDFLHEKKYVYSLTDDKIIERIVDDENINLNHMVLVKGTNLPEHYSNSNV